MIRATWTCKNCQYLNEVEVEHLTYFFECSECGADIEGVDIEFLEG